MASIVAKFNKDLNRIEFYEIVDRYKQFTIIRKQGTNSHYAWDNQKKVLSNKLWIVAKPKDKSIYKVIINSVDVWMKRIIFFWADSKFVTEYGLPNYDKLISIYKELIGIRENDQKLQDTLEDIKNKEGLLAYIKARIFSFRFIMAQRSTMKKLEKEFKLIW